jgi:hypothetical protein
MNIGNTTRDLVILPISKSIDNGSWILIKNAVDFTVRSHIFNLLMDSVNSLVRQSANNIQNDYR